MGIFKRNEIDSNKKGWVVDLSPDDIVNPDCYWYFLVKSDAIEFNQLVESGIEPHRAFHILENWE